MVYVLYSKILEQRRRRIATIWIHLNIGKLFNLYFNNIEDNIVFDNEYKIYFEYKLFIKYKYSFNQHVCPKLCQKEFFISNFL